MDINGSNMCTACKRQQAGTNIIKFIHHGKCNEKCAPYIWLPCLLRMLLYSYQAF